MYMKYTTKDKVEQYLGGDSISENIDHYIEAMSRYMDQATDRTLVVDTSGDAEERKYDGNGTPKLLVDDFVSLDSLVVSSNTVPSSSYVSYPANKGYSNEIVITGGTAFYKDRLNVVLTGYFGRFASADGEEVPFDIEHACTVLVAGIIQNTDSPNGVVKTESIGRYSVTYASDKQAKDFEMANATIDHYRKIAV